MSKITCVSAASIAFFLTISGAAVAGELPIGDPQEKNGMEIAAIYLQPVRTEPAEPVLGRSDIHLEADIHAAKGNPNGFGEGEWIPYLEIAYMIEKVGSDWSAHGSFMAMVASDGPHYGANVVLDGPGKYRIDYKIVPPLRNGMYRHTDKETGVGEWSPAFNVNWTFNYFGTGKKGGY